MEETLNQVHRLLLKVEASRSLRERNAGIVVAAMSAATGIALPSENECATIVREAAELLRTCDGTEYQGTLKDLRARLLAAQEGGEYHASGAHKEGLAQWEGRA